MEMMNYMKKAMWIIIIFVVAIILSSICFLYNNLSDNKYDLKNISDSQKKEIIELLNCTEILNDIADYLDVSVQEVPDMNTRLKAHDGSLNAVVNHDDSEGGAEWMDFIYDTKPNQEDQLAYRETMTYRRRLFKKAITVLNPREKDILYNLSSSKPNSNKTIFE